MPNPRIREGGDAENAEEDDPSSFSSFDPASFPSLEGREGETNNIINHASMTQKEEEW